MVAILPSEASKAKFEKTPDGKRLHIILTSNVPSTHPIPNLLIRHALFCTCFGLLWMFINGRVNVLEICFAVIHETIVLMAMSRKLLVVYFAVFLATVNVFNATQYTVLRGYFLYLLPWSGHEHPILPSFNSTPGLNGTVTLQEPPTAFQLTMLYAFHAELNISMFAPLIRGLILLYVSGLCFSVALLTVAARREEEKQEQIFVEVDDDQSTH